MIPIDDRSRVTTFSVVSSHIISSSALFPVVWLIIGSFLQTILVQKQILNEPVVTGLYYIVMLASFYGGIKYSLSFIDRRYIVSNPQSSLKFSILSFLFGVLFINYLFIYFEESFNWFRLSFSILLTYMFVILTNKYFSAINPNTEYIEYPFLWQIFFMLTNLLLIIAFFISYMILSRVFPWIHAFLVFALVIWFSPYSEIIEKLFIPFFYKNNEKIAFKKATIIFLIALPMDLFLISILVSQYQ